MDLDDRTVIIPRKEDAADEPEPVTVWPLVDAALDTIDADSALVGRPIREAVADYSFEIEGKQRKLTISIGFACWSADMTSTSDLLRAAEDLPEQFYHVTLVDPRMVPVANVTLGRMLSARRAVALRDIGEASLMTIPVDQSVEEVAYTFNQYHLISAPVVDAGGRLVGTVTIDDAMAVLSEENEEDLLLLAGVSEGSVSDSVMDTVRARILWLAVNLVTAILASVVIAQFDAALSRFVALAVLMPVVASMGGNAGTQSLTVAVRALATRDLTASNMWRVIRREGLVGLLNGLAFAATMGIVSVIWFGEPMIGAVMAVAMVLTLVAAAVGGVMVPIALDRLKVDPAVASGPFVTTITDVVGFFVFLGIATLVLL